MVPWNNVGSCGIIARFCLKSLKPILEISRPSILMYPVLASKNLKKAVIIVDLPAPVRPTIPILLKAGTLNETF